MSISVVVALVIAVGFTVAFVVLLSWAIVAGNFYLPSTRERVERILDGKTPRLLYHYMSVRDFDRGVDLNAGTVVWRRGKRTLNIYYQRAVFFYAGHSATGARSNHPRKRRRHGAVVALELQPLLDATAHVRPWFRRWDQAPAVRADYTGPITGYRRDIDILTTKTNPAPPDLIPVEPTGTALSSKGTP